MNLSQFLLALRARSKIIALVAVVTLITSIVVTLMLPKSYVASAALVVNYKGVDAVTGLALPAQLMPGYVATQVDIIKSRAVGLRAVDLLQLAEAPEVQRQFREETGGVGTVRDWLADLLLDKVDVVPTLNSNVLTLVFRGTDPQFVAGVANAFAAAYQQVSVQLKTQPAQQAAGLITSQNRELRERYELAQAKLSRYQKENGLVSTDNRFDVESARLSELSAQLVAVQGQLMDAGSRQQQTQGNGSASPDVMNNPLVQSLKSSLALAEAKFAETSQRLAPNHPQYLAAQSEVDKLRTTLDEQVRLASSGVAGSAQIYQRREAELSAAVSAQKAKVLQLNSLRDEMTVLSNEAENARRAYEGGALRHSQTSLEGQSSLADIALLTAATPPIKPVGPQMLINAALALVVGVMLGVGVALLLELGDRRVRSARQLGETFALPVLGAIDRPRTLKQRRSPASPGAGVQPAQA